MTRIIIFLVILEIIFIGSLICTVYGIKDYLKSAETQNLTSGLAGIVIFIEAIIGLETYFFETTVTPIFLWTCGAISLILFVLAKTKCYKNVKNIIDELNKAEIYKEISDGLFTGFINYNYHAPSRGNNPVKALYEKSFKEFAKLQLEDQYEDLKALQKLVRKAEIASKIVIYLFLAFFLQIIPLVISAIIYQKTKNQ